MCLRAMGINHWWNWRSSEVDDLVGTLARMAKANGLFCLGSSAAIEDPPGGRQHQGHPFTHSYRGSA